MDIAALVSYLAPLLPQLLNIAAGTGDGGGQEGPGFGQRIWERLRGRVEERPAASEAVNDVAENPDDEELRTVLKVQLKKLLAEDPGLAAEIGRIFDEARSAGVAGTVTTVTASGQGSVAIGRDVSGSRITTTTRSAD
ncbi:hypothetical protein [Planomonospora venezuelensis]|uniref:Uncharacterized protein n=1 Tax=Planomonospora venezuelensis TaxID=1999 RepID=A0A841D8W4_PLAVE|nr:hypothetical protein [Planomonospora venezuelensis]MBB5967072.1 hypothetical protein [Planomonospora venezuelensis]GIN04912.1 hypothetical protein Pve01_65700 [Planomonospora venezuelensis]